ncbi:hypothetical protein BJ138DRAFT_997361 [Hygrophoropsis aurantiaca]|uniref:Uncharacterized protein n=1 Tax=Hygrophoropsis aurantiaca TaxID=72124 RepID=A0ACB8AQX1_9AGAM|nr:hypothetical protein BJ138DRAFT_997361 [Hygrophoropsis aurantiaca]
MESDPADKGKDTEGSPPSHPHLLPHDFHDLTFDSASSSSTSNVSYRSSLTAPIPNEYISALSSTVHRNQFVPNDHNSSTTASRTSLIDDGPPLRASPLDKGKAKEVPPILPPLSFSPTELGYSTIDWPSPEQASPIPGPSSYGSGHTSLLNTALTPPHSSHSDIFETPPEPLTLQRRHTEHTSAFVRIPSRRGSFSSLSIHSTRSITALPMSRMKDKLGSARNPGSLARKLLSRNRTDIAIPSLTTSFNTDPHFDDLATVGQGSCFLPWKGVRTDILPPSPYTDISAKDDFSVDHTGSSFPLESHHSNDVVTLKCKGRSYSSPLPASVFDIVADAPNDIFVPLPVEVRNYFDEALPRELRLQILSALVSLHEAEHNRRKDDKQWTAIKASSSKHRWVGKDRGLRELVKLSRVSKSWRALAFDGQLWMDVDLRAFPKLPTPFLLRLAEVLGPFVRNVDLTGHVGLTPDTLKTVTNNLCIRSTGQPIPCHTQLTDVNLQGCSAISTESLHDLIRQSPSLRNLCVKGLKAVTNATLDDLAGCLKLELLNMSRCINVDAEGIRAYVAASLASGNKLLLKELRVSALTGINDDTLAALGRAAPLLEVLDLSYCRNLHNSSLEAFVACTEADEDIATVTLTSRQAGRDPRDTARYIRRITRLRHLSLSHCILLTDIACSNLAHVMPRLEFLELAGIGTELKDEGIIRLLETTPYLKRLDLEDASDISDAVLTALTPPAQDEQSSSKLILTNEPPPTGHALEHLIVSYAIDISNNAFLALIQNCSRLRVLEADSTCMSGTVLREFVRLASTRGISDATLVAVDCRAVGESIVKDVSASTRPRKGWRSYDARKLAYLDGRDDEELKVGQDECDEKRVVLKSFYNWQTVDAVQAARERRRKATRRVGSNSSEANDDQEGGKETLTRARWWSPSGRRSSGNNTPDIDREGCIVM